MNHSFNVEIAKIYGVDGAIIVENLYFWIAKNRANEKHYHDGQYWTYNSVNAFTVLFPYWSYKQIRRILDNLIKKGAINTGNYNKVGYDKTKWYGLSQHIFDVYHLGTSICPNGHTDSPKRAHPITQKGKPIPDINTNINTGIFKNPTIEEIKTYCHERKNKIDPEHFFDYQVSRGWILSNGKKMKCWKATIRTWEKNDKKTPQKQMYATFED
ncbi:MAG: hypothetical protein GY714_18245 [Desulfobacterales bacterium]|nr:hypothetical protein [Desulfobacterales bacterium]